ncbi:hypothetical protein Ancab_005447 [Ancistrocladus abbreviatus]
MVNNIYIHSRSSGLCPALTLLSQRSVEGRGLLLPNNGIGITSSNQLGFSSKKNSIQYTQWCPGVGSVSTEIPIDDEGRATQLYDLKIDLKAVHGVPTESYINVQSFCDGVILFSASSSYDDCTGYAGQQLFLCNLITRASYRLPSLRVSKKAKFWDASEWAIVRWEVWTAKNWDPNCWAKEDVFQIDPLLLSKIAQFDQTIVQQIASMGDKIFVFIGCGNDMHLQLAVLDMCSRKMKPVCFAGEGREFDGKDNNMWGDFDVLCHVGSLFQLP